MQWVALSPPDVILSDWGSNHHDCFCGAVTHDCACAAAKLSIAGFSPLSFCCFGCRHLEICKQNENSPSAFSLPKHCITVYVTIHISRCENYSMQYWPLQMHQLCESMTPVVTPLRCCGFFFMESCCAAASFRWIYNVLVISCNINLLRAIYRQ